MASIHYSREAQTNIIRLQFARYADYEIDDKEIDVITLITSSMTFSMLEQLTKALRVISKGVKK